MLQCFCHAQRSAIADCYCAEVYRRGILAPAFADYCTLAVCYGAPISFVATAHTQMSQLLFNSVSASVVKYAYVEPFTCLEALLASQGCIVSKNDMSVCGGT